MEEPKISAHGRWTHCYPTDFRNIFPIGAHGIAEGAAKCVVRGVIKSYVWDVDDTRRDSMTKYSLFMLINTPYLCT